MQPLRHGYAATLRRKLLGGGAWALGGKMLAAVSALVVNVILSRSLSSADYGAYFIAISLVTFAATLGTFGIDLTAVRVIAESLSAKRFDRVRQEVRRIAWLGLAFSLLTALVYLLLYKWITLGIYRSPVLLGATVGIALWMWVAVFQRLLAEIFRGFHNIPFSTLMSGIGTRGGGILMGIFQPLAVAILAMLDLATLRNVLLTSGVLSLLIVTVGVYVLQDTLRKLPREDAPTTPPEASRNILAMSAPLFVATLMLAIRVQSDVLILGALGAKEEVALYGSALRLVSLVVTPLLIMNAVLPPIIAELYTSKKLAQLERLLRSVSTLVGLPSLFILTLLAVAGAPILGLIYGDFYREGASVLLVLSLGQLLNVLAGSCSLVLSMTGHQRMNMLATSVSAVVAVVGGLILTKTYGMMGMAVSSAIALSLQNVLMVIIAKQKLGIWTHVHFSPYLVQDVKRLLKRGA